MIHRTPVSTSASSTASSLRFDNRSLLLFAALSFSATGVAWAQSSAAPMQDDKAPMAMFTQADKDADKALSANEAKAIPALSERFAQVDANGDGKVSEAEFAASMAPAKK